MKNSITIVLLFISACAMSQDLPIITFENNDMQLGDVTRGPSIEISFPFTNTGTADLIIEVVSSCKCTHIEWPKEALKPGESGVISVVFDTSQQTLGTVTKTVDVVSNTDPMLVEARFTARIVP